MILSKLCFMRPVSVFLMGNTSFRVTIHCCLVLKMALSAAVVAGLRLSKKSYPYICKPLIQTSIPNDLHLVPCNVLIVSLCFCTDYYLVPHDFHVSMQCQTSFSLKSRLYWDTSTQHVCLHRAGLGLFMELSSRPGEGTAVEPHLAPSAPSELHWTPANVISLLMLLLSLLSLCSMARSFYWGSVSGHVVRLWSYTTIKTLHATAWSTGVCVGAHASTALLTK